MNNNNKLPQLNITRNFLQHMLEVARQRADSKDEDTNTRQVWCRFHYACEELLEHDMLLKQIDTTGVGDWKVFGRKGNQRDESKTF